MKHLIVRISRFVAIGIVLWIALPSPHGRRARAVVTHVAHPLDERVTLSIWFVDKDRPNAEAEASAVAAALAEARAPTSLDTPPIPGDATWSERTLASAAGSEIARIAMTTQLGLPSAPIASAWGFWIIVPRDRRLG